MNLSYFLQPLYERTDGEELASFQRQVEQSKRELDEQHVCRLTRSRGGRAMSALSCLDSRAHLENKGNRSTRNQVSLLPVLSKQT